MTIEIEVQQQPDGTVVVTHDGELWDGGTDAPAVASLLLQMLAARDRELVQLRAENERYVGKNAELALSSRLISDRYENANRLSNSLQTQLMRTNHEYIGRLRELKEALPRLFGDCGNLTRQQLDAIFDELSPLLRPISIA